MNKKVLITGSCGFVMGNLIRKAIYEKQPYQFASIDRVNDKAINSMYWNKNHTFHIADIKDPHIIDVIFQFEKPDIVIHGAAETKNSESYIDSNISGTQVIINACLKHKVEKIIYISTDEVYGPPQKTSWQEDDSINPVTLYAISKGTGESLVKAASFRDGLIYNIVRLSNAYGPRQGADKFVPKVIKNITQNERFIVPKRGSTTRDWSHVFDHCSGVLTVLNNGKDDEIYNISSNQDFTDIEVVQKICNAMNKGHNLNEYEQDQFEHLDFESSIDSSKIRKIGWEPKYKFKDGIINTVEWYINNQWFLK